MSLLKNFVIIRGNGTNDELMVDKESVPQCLFDTSGQLELLFHGFDIDEIFNFLNPVKDKKVLIKGLYYHDGKDLSSYYKLENLEKDGDKIKAIMQKMV